jgi:hypothetical protein
MPAQPNTNERDRRDRTEPLDRGLPSVDEPDEADGAMEAPAEAFRTREEIEAVRRDEGPAEGTAGDDPRSQPYPAGQDR